MQNFWILNLVVGKAIGTLYKVKIVTTIFCQVIFPVGSWTYFQVSFGIPLHLPQLVKERQLANLYHMNHNSLQTTYVFIMYFY
jgi:hypothetical protein